MSSLKLWRWIIGLFGWKKKPVEKAALVVEAPKPVKKKVIHRVTRRSKTGITKGAFGKPKSLRGE